MHSFTNKLTPFAHTNSFDNLIIDYINDEEFLEKFYAFDDSLSGVEQRIKSYKNPRLNRQNLLLVLQNQYKLSGIKDIPEKVTENIHSLSHENTFTITAGHQLNIFGGPLYVFYKLIAAINLAESLKIMFSSFHFVPVFWMATEDHDIEEITSFNLFGKNYNWKSSWKGITGKMPLDGLQDVISELKGALGTSIHADELTSLISNAYQNSSSLAEATRKWVNSLFGKYGLVILDGNEKSFKKTFSDIISDEVINQTSVSIINETTLELEKKYHSQAKPREINLFYIGENYRERIIRENDKYKILNKDLSFSRDEIINEINSRPENFSPNVILRPLFQESILPNIIFTGGPAEISYWLELRGLFDHYNVPMPVLFHRCSALILEKNVVSKLEKLGIDKDDIFLPADDLIKRYIQQKENDTTYFNSMNDVISNEFSKLGIHVSQADPSLRASVESEQHRITTSLKTIEEKVIRSLKKKNETEVNQIRKIKEKLFPAGKLQERVDTFIPYYLNWGAGFIDMLKANLDPLKKQFITLEENNE